MWALKRHKTIIISDAVYKTHRLLRDGMASLRVVLCILICYSQKTDRRAHFTPPKVYIIANPCSSEENLEKILLCLHQRNTI